eukprot:XP_011610772.1 PREDICTED: uncharacterized protein LOC105417635 isoform X2 [Takifugu rubripes]
MRLLLLLAALLSILILHPVTAAATAAPARLERWVRSGLQSLQWDQLDRCLRMSSLPEAECRRLAHLPPSAVAVYVSEPRTATDKVLAILPDSSVGMVSSKIRSGFSVSQMLNGAEGSHRRHQLFPGSMAHDAVLVLDPSPGENFGHPVVLFYVDVNVTKKRCSHLDGIYLGEECLTPALKGRCQNQMKRRQTGPERLLDNVRLVGGPLRGGTISSGSGSRLVERATGGLCEVHFLPLVVEVGDSNRTQRLRCADHAEFARCPQPLPMGSPSLPISSCELNKNTRRCHQQPLATHLSCRLYQTCDHAVLISGGWQQQITFQHHVQSLQKFYRMLQNNGFPKDHIKTFFSNGQLSDGIDGVYSATEKAVIRNHISYICRKQHCADTLVLYLNSPTCNDGTMLLWDANLNGIGQAWQSHSHQRANPFWEESDWSYIKPATCLLDHFGKGPGMSRLLEPWTSLLNVTLAGAPCNITPPLTDGEMRREYQGCQNLPTALWHRKHRRIN